MPLKIAALLMLLPLSAAAAEPLTVQVRSGRTYTAPVDIRTGPQRLWLRFEGRSVQLLRPIRWDEITSARYQGRQVPAAALPALAESIKTEFSLIDELPSAAPAGLTHAEAARRILFGDFQ